MNRIDQALNEMRKIDELAEMNSPVHRFCSLSKMAVTIMYILTVMSFPRHALSALILMIIYPASVSALSGISLRFALHKMRYVLPLVMAVGIFQPFLEREIMLRIGPVPVSAGVISMLVLMLKGIYCLLASFLLIAATPADRLFASLRRIHVPQIFVTLLLLTWRYIAVLGEEASVMMTAYQLRAPDQKGIHWRSWGSFIGQLLLRTMDRAQELYESMLMRGYHGEIVSEPERFSGKDLIWLLIWAVLFPVLRSFNIAEMIL
ncbi:MAG: cobalt ECF transporter T component CbiQ [Solobacterium sp.]|nr:cobalt ECF transporter T component CbiQ [Solobacterium sp.]